MQPWMRDAFWQGLWGGVFELVALGGVAVWVNIIYQRIQSRQQRRRDLIDEIDAFSHGLYKPRKLYQATLERPLAEAVAGALSEGERAALRARRLHDCLSELTEAAGRFRAVQVKLVPLFGFDVELFGYYLAIWRYLREIRKRMERGESLYFHHEGAESADAFYRLVDSFRYRVQVAPSSSERPGLLTPPPALLARMEERGAELYAHYFAPRPAELTAVSPAAGTPAP